MATKKPIPAEPQESENFLTQEKFDELQKELDELTTVRRKEIAESLEYARSLGDLSENAEYQAARELQAATEERIRRLEGIIKSATIVSAQKKGVVGFGSKVTIKKKGEKDEHTYTIVGSEEANMREWKISHLSPLGQALMGRKKGESFVLKLPSGERQEFTLTEVS
jgi:transcription elongation factor GreA